LSKNTGGGDHGETAVVDLLVLSLEHASRSLLLRRLDAKRVEAEISRNDIILESHGIGRVGAEDVALLVASVLEDLLRPQELVGKDVKTSGEPESLTKGQNIIDTAETGSTQ